jgi:hypothetical protein
MPQPKPPIIGTVASADVVQLGVLLTHMLAATPHAGPVVLSRRDGTDGVAVIRHRLGIALRAIVNATSETAATVVTVARHVADVLGVGTSDAQWLVWNCQRLRYFIANTAVSSIYTFFRLNSVSAIAGTVCTNCVSATLCCYYTADPVSCHSCEWSAVHQ